jgi:hypothetical protein
LMKKFLMYLFDNIRQIQMKSEKKEKNNNLYA